jgi:predicted lipoprotein with Yx(FWY)xxD motif
MPTRGRMRSPVILRPWILALPLAAAALAAAGCGSSPIYVGTIATPSVTTGTPASATATPRATASPASTSPAATTTPTTSPSSTKPAPSPTATASGTTITTSQSKLGTILVDSSGFTVYLFAKDTGTSSTCYGACAGIWPPVLTTGAPVAGSGADASLLGTTKRTDGKLQVTYAGHPLYYYTGDSKAGQTNGQGQDQFGGKWYAVTPNGSEAG